MPASSGRIGGLAAIAALVVLVAAAPARADSVTHWNQIAASALQSSGAASPPGAGQGATSVAHLAMVQGAVFDAVNAIAGGREPYVSSPAAMPWYSQDAAVAAAARRVLVDGGLGIPAGRIPSIEAAYDAALAAVPDGPAKSGGIATGETAAGDMIAARTGDGRFGPYRFPQSTSTGGWRLVPPLTTTDAGAWLKDVTPFVLRDPDRFRGRPPLPMASSRYAEEFDEVKALGRATGSTRTPDQTAAAQFWGTSSAPATMASIIRSLVTGQDGTTAESARMLALTYANAADALIVTWRDKARHGFWRPYTAIREAAGDGNPATEPDPEWTSLIVNPPYPEHPSGLATFGGAVTETMQFLLGRDDVTFSGTSPAGMTREFTTLSQLRENIIDARVWSGVHFRFADEEGAKTGRRVAHWNSRHAFR